MYIYIYTHIHKITWIWLTEYYLYKSYVLIKKINSIHINARTILPDSKVRSFKIMDKREESMDIKQTKKNHPFVQPGINTSYTLWEKTAKSHIRKGCQEEIQCPSQIFISNQGRHL